MKSCYNYQIIKTLIKFEKETRHRLHVLIKNKITVSSAKCETTSRARDAFCHLHRHDVLIVPLTGILQCLITSMTRTFLLVLISLGDNPSRSRILC